jgi:hypothetical protein
MLTNKTRRGHFSAVGLALAAGVILGYVAGAAHQPGVAVAEVREGEQRAAFKSGAERSLAVLEEISATLTSIDRRVEGIQQAVTAPPEQPEPSIVPLRSGERTLP